MFLGSGAAASPFRRLLGHLEANRLVPSEMFAYRRQQPPQQAGLLCRWLVAFWASRGTDVCVADWDESNAFCNIPRRDLPALVDDMCPTFAGWASRFYNAMKVYVVTPYGLTALYRLLHGGDQGDSGRVGTYLAVGVVGAATPATSALYHRAPNEGTAQIDTPSPP